MRPQRRFCVGALPQSGKMPRQILGSPFAEAPGTSTDFHTWVLHRGEMTMSKTVLCATDLSASGEDAARLALSLSERLGAHLNLVHALEAPKLGSFVDPAVAPAAKALEERVQRSRSEAKVKLEALQGALGSPKATAKLLPGRPVEALLYAAEASGAELVVVGPHQRSEAWSARASERLFGTTAQRIVRHAKVPVLVASGDVDQARGALDAGDCRILVGYDFSPGADETVRVLRQLFGSAPTLILAHAVPEPFTPDDAPVDWTSLREQWRQQLTTRLKAAAEKFGPGTEVAIGSGEAGQVLTALRESHRAHLIAVGAHSGEASRILLGSTAEETVRSARVPVLVVPPEQSP